MFERCHRLKRFENSIKMITTVTSLRQCAFRDDVIQSFLALMSPVSHVQLETVSCTSFKCSYNKQWLHCRKRQFLIVDLKKCSCKTQQLTYSNLKTDIISHFFCKMENAMLLLKVTDCLGLMKMCVFCMAMSETWF